VETILDYRRGQDEVDRSRREAKDKTREAKDKRKVRNRITQWLTGKKKWTKQLESDSTGRVTVQGY
jgi:hypothetical protein